MLTRDHQTQLLAALHSVVVKDRKAASAVADALLVSPEAFFTMGHSLGLAQKDLLAFVKKDPAFDEKVDRYIASIQPELFPSLRPTVDILVDNRKSTALNKKAKEAERQEEFCELLNFMQSLMGDGVTFLVDYTYEEFSSQRRALRNANLDAIPSKIATQFIRELFGAAPSTNELGFSSSYFLTQSAAALEKLYKEPKLVELTQREFAKNPKLATAVGKSIATTVNQLTQLSLIENNDGMKLSFSQANQLLKVCANAVTLHRIPVLSEQLRDALNFKGVCEKEALLCDGQLPSKRDYTEAQQNLNAFKRRIKSEIIFSSPRVSSSLDSPAL